MSKLLANTLVKLAQQVNEERDRADVKKALLDIAKRARNFEISNAELIKKNSQLIREQETDERLAIHFKKRIDELVTRVVDKQRQVQHLLNFYDWLDENYNLDKATKSKMEECLIAANSVTCGEEEDKKYTETPLKAE